MMDVNVKFDAESFRLAATEWFNDNMTNFENQQDADDCLNEWVSSNVGRFIEVGVK